MHFVRKLALVLDKTVLKLGLLGFALAFALLGVVGEPTTIKQSLEQSGIYGQAVDGLVSGLRQGSERDSQESEEPAEGLPFDRPEIRRAANEAFPPEQIQAWSEGFIDGTYLWLNDEAPAPAFEIDLRENKQDFITRVANYAENRVRNLRPCTQAENLQLARQEVDIFNLPCRPPIDIAAERQRLVNELQAAEFFGDGVITAEDLSPEGQGAFSDENNSLPRTYQALNSLPIIFAAVSLLAMAGLVLLAENKRVGVKKLGIVLIGSGVLIAVAVFIFNLLFGNIGQKDSPLGGMIGAADGNLQSFAMEALASIFGSFNAKILAVAAVYAVVGVVILVALHFTRSEKPQNKANPGTKAKR